MKLSHSSSQHFVLYTKYPAPCRTCQDSADNRACPASFYSPAQCVNFSATSKPIYRERTDKEGPHQAPCLESLVENVRTKEETLPLWVKFLSHVTLVAGLAEGLASFRPKLWPDQPWIMHPVLEAVVRLLLTKIGQALLHKLSWPNTFGELAILVYWNKFTKVASNVMSARDIHLEWWTNQNLIVELIGTLWRPEKLQYRQLQTTCPSTGWPTHAIGPGHYSAWVHQPQMLSERRSSKNANQPLQASRDLIALYYPSCHLFIRLLIAQHIISSHSKGIASWLAFPCMV